MSSINGNAAIDILALQKDKDKERLEEYKELLVKCDEIIKKIKIRKNKK